MHTTRSAPPDTLDRRQVLLLWYWPRARGPYIHLGHGLPRARVLTAALAVLFARTLALLSCGRPARGWYLLAAASMSA